MKYSSKKAEQYWSERVSSVDEIRAVLSYDLPDHVNKAYHAWETGLMLQALGGGEGKRVLDLACGVGRITEILLRHGALVTSVDNSEEMLKRTMEKVAAFGKQECATLVKASAHSIPLADDGFDAIVCFGLLEHLPEDIRDLALREMVRMVKGDGTILLVVHNDDSIFFKKVERYKMREQQDNGYFVQPMDLEKIAALFNDSGFEVETIGNDFMYSFLRQAVERMTDIEIGEEQSKRLFEFSAQFDLENRMDEELVTCMSDHLMVKVRKSGQ